MSAAASLDLPMPASPDSSTTWPSQVFAFAQRRNSSSSSSFRPTSENAGVHRLEAARDRTYPQHRERLHRPGDPLEVLGPEVSQLEETADKPEGGLGNDDRV